MQTICGSIYLNIENKIQRRELMATIKVCDVIMGGGKTSAAITYMKENKNERFIFITPYLEQVERIKRECSEMKFVSPKITENEDTKKKNWHKLIEERRNIATTHQLFGNSTVETEEILKDAGYILIMDEALNAIKYLPGRDSDVRMLIDTGYIKIDKNGYLKTGERRYHGSSKTIRKIISDIKIGALQHIDEIVFWSAVRPELYQCFKNVIILTYMFDCQTLSYYYAIKNIKYEYMGITYENGMYRFVYDINKTNFPNDIFSLREKIHIYDGKKINSIGDEFNALSSTWYNRGKHKKCEHLRKNMRNLFVNIYKAKGEDVVWTTFKKVKEACSPAGAKKSFLPCNARATNAFADRHYVAYCINVFYNPLLVQFMRRHSIEIDNDRYALSEMVQFIFRSAIRKGEDIWVYIPSFRMRKLFQNWLDDLSNGVGIIPTEEQMKKCEVCLLDMDFDDYDDIDDDWEDEDYE